jgi:heme iron utilization protein
MSQAQEEWSPQEAARALMRVARHAALATADAQTGFPYASLVGVASAPCGSPLLLLSRLARHTRNLLEDPRASLLLTGAHEVDGLAAARVTVFGTLQREEAETLLQRYVARHADAAGFAGFGDFALYRMEVQSAHLVAGFGRISELTAAEILTDIAGAEEMIAAERRISDHMNEDHRDATQLYATRLLGAPDGDWHFVGCDPDGAEIAQGSHVLRVPFTRRALTATDVRLQLVELVKQARATG